MSRPMAKDSAGVNILVDYLFMLIITVVMFAIIVILIQSVMSKSDSIVLREEFDIISNDMANRISAFSSEVYINGQPGDDTKAIVNSQVIYFDLPELVKGKQYNVDIQPVGTKTYLVTVSYVANSEIQSQTFFYSDLPVSICNFYSQPGRYKAYYDGAKIQIEAGA